MCLIPHPTSFIIMLQCILHSRHTKLLSSPSTAHTFLHDVIFFWNVYSPPPQHGKLLFIFQKSDQISPALWRLLWYSQADIVAPSSVFPQHLNYHCVMSHCIIIISLQASLPPRLLAFLRPCLMACFIFSTRNNASHKQFFKSRKQAIESAPWRTGSSILSINSLGPRVSGAEVERKESYLCMRH